MSIFKSIWFRLVICLAALASPFFFAPIFTIFIATMSGFYLPIMPIVVGLTVDLLYYPGSHLPLGVVCGVIISLFILLVRYVVRTRIM